MEIYSEKAPLENSEELHHFEMDAFLGALDDLKLEFSNSTADRRSDAEIIAAVEGVFDTASSYYQEDYATQLSLMDALQSRLSAMVCNDDHFSQAYESYSQKNTANDAHVESAAHAHDHEEDEKHGKKKKKKSMSWFFELLMAKRA